MSAKSLKHLPAEIRAWDRYICETCFFLQENAAGAVTFEHRLGGPLFDRDDRLLLILRTSPGRRLPPPAGLLQFLILGGEPKYPLKTGSLRLTQCPTRRPGIFSGYTSPPPQLCGSAFNVRPMASHWLTPSRNS